MIGYQENAKSGKSLFNSSRFSSLSPKKKSGEVDAMCGSKPENIDSVTSRPSTFRTTPPDDKLEEKRDRAATSLELAPLSLTQKN